MADGEDREGQEPEELVRQKEDLLIQQKIYDMILYAYPALEQMPKSQKFSLAQDMKHCMDRIMRLTIAANKKYTKRTTLQELDVEIAALKIYLRIAYDLRYLPPKKYEVWSGMMVEIGKMAGVFALNLNDPRTNSNHNVGFRAALPQSRISGAHGPCFSAGGIKGPVPMRRSGRQKAKTSWKPLVTGPRARRTP